MDGQESGDVSSTDNLNSNPYAATTLERADGFQRRPELARFTRRLSAYLIDVSYTLLLVVLMFVAFNFIEFNDLMLGIVIFAIFLGEAVQWYLLARNGQTLGKIVLGLQVVNNANGTPVEFLGGVVFRAWLCWLVYFPAFYLLPIWVMLMIANVCFFVCSRDRRCLHDFIAGTRVIEIDKQPETGEEPSRAKGHVAMPSSADRNAIEIDNPFK